MVSVLSTVFGNGGEVIVIVDTGFVMGEFLGDFEQDEKKNIPAIKKVNNVLAFIKLVSI